MSTTTSTSAAKDPSTSATTSTSAANIRVHSAAADGTDKVEVHSSKDPSTSATTSTSAANIRVHSAAGEGKDKVEANSSKDATSTSKEGDAEQPPELVYVIVGFAWFMLAVCALAWGVTALVWM